MPIIEVEWPEAKKLPISFAIVGPSRVRLDPKEAQRCLDYFKQSGFPDEPEVILMQCRYQMNGEMKHGKIYIAAHSSEPAYLHRFFFHEAGHWVEFKYLHGDSKQYFKIRGDISQNVLKDAPYSEVFAEDFRFLFGTDLARKYGHGYRYFVGDLGYSMAYVPPELLERRERLKAYIMSQVPKPKPEAPGERKPGASKFVDVEPDRWSREAIEKVAAAGLMVGYPDGTFKPTQAVTREELAAVVCRLLESLKGGGGNGDERKSA